MSIRKGKICSGEGRFGGTAGFTLLEVMIAVSLIAIALVTLIGAQSRSIDIATRSRFEAMAALLAQRKLAEICLLEYGLVNDGTGDFGEDHPGFRWKSQVTELTEEEIGLKGADRMLKAVDLTISLEQDEDLSFSLRTIVLRRSKGST